MAKSGKKQIEEIANELGWTVRFGKQRPDRGSGRAVKTEKYVEFFQQTPAGEDFGITEFYDRLDDIPGLVYERFENFDIEEHVMMWLEAKRNGLAGVPDVVTLVHDGQEIDEMLEDLAISLCQRISWR